MVGSLALSSLSPKLNISQLENDSVDAIGKKLQFHHSLSKHVVAYPIIIVRQLIWSTYRTNTDFGIRFTDHDRA
jgi:hypothetical protein